MRNQTSGRGAVVSLLARIACVLLLGGSGIAHAAQPPKNPPPTVILTSPANGESFVAPATIPLAATASDSNGTVTRVDFFAGSTLIGTSTTAPYTATWSNVAAGSYTLTARATDNGGAVTTSAGVSITVGSATALVITSPANGAAINVSSSLTVSGTFEGPTNSTILVDNGNSTVLATITGNSYAASFAFGQGMAVGTNTITVRLGRPDRTAATRSVSVTGFDTPRVAFTGPACNTFETPASIPLAVDARAPGAAITRVDFFRASTLLGSVTAPPYLFNWTDAPNGTHTITANAHSNQGQVGSATMQITVVGPNTPPSISITSPAAGATFTAPANIPIAVSATDSDGTVKLVEYFANAVGIGASNVPPFGLTWSNVAPGAYALTARATDDRNGQTTSAPVNISVNPANQPPTVTLTAPAQGATFTAPATITLTATAADADGVIAAVEFYHGATLIGTATTPPYTVNWNAVVSGTQTLTARAIDNLGATTVSAPVTITVNGAIVFIHNDFAGNPIAATDGAGTILWKENFRPYGDRLNNQPASAGNRQWFHGKAVDADTGLSYFGARYYDPVLGRFMGIDPAGFSEKNLHSFNLFAYGNNNPYKFIDPDGNSPLSVFLVEVAKQTGVGYVAGVAADAISQYAAFGQVDLYMAATSNAAIAGGEAGLLSGTLSGAVKSWALAKAAASNSSGAENAADAVKLGKSLASQSQVSEAGIPMAGAGTNKVFRDAARVAKEHGGNPSDWAKMTSSAHKAKDGTRFETHWVENVNTGQRVEFKTNFIVD